MRIDRRERSFRRDFQFAADGCGCARERNRRFSNRAKPAVAGAGNAKRKGVAKSFRPVAVAVPTGPVVSFERTWFLTASLLFFIALVPVSHCVFRKTIVLLLCFVLGVLAVTRPPRVGWEIYLKPHLDGLTFAHRRFAVHPPPTSPVREQNHLCCSDLVFSRPNDGIDGPVCMMEI